MFIYIVHYLPKSIWALMQITTSVVQLYATPSSVKYLVGNNFGTHVMQDVMACRTL